uniref:Putative endonuclease n=1 Tax=Ixodes scapularis TaxID=6945 RepID=A0A4D5RAL1_IXOSC
MTPKMALAFCLALRLVLDSLPTWKRRHRARTSRTTTWNGLSSTSCPRSQSPRSPNTRRRGTSMCTSIPTLQPPRPTGPCPRNPSSKMATPWPTQYCRSPQRQSPRTSRLRSTTTRSQRPRTSTGPATAIPKDSSCLTSRRASGSSTACQGSRSSCTPASTSSPRTLVRTDRAYSASLSPPASLRP